MASNSQYTNDDYAVSSPSTLVIYFHEDASAALNSVAGSKARPHGWRTPITVPCGLIKGLPPRQPLTAVKFLEKVTLSA